MSFISNASGITLREGTFNNIQGDLVNIFQAENLARVDIGALLESLLGEKRRRREESTDAEEPARKRRRENAEEDGPEVVRYKDLNLTHEIGRGPGYLLHAGNMKRRAVIVKVFNAGTNAHKHCSSQHGRFSRHPNVLRIEGTSAPTSIHHFIAYEDAHRKTAEGPLAAALKEDLDKGILLGFKLISSLSSGIDYLSTQGITIPLESFDVFLDIGDRFLLGINPPLDPNTAEEDTRTAARSVWDLFNALCQKVLRSANRLLHDEDIERTPAVFDSSPRPAEILGPFAVPAPGQAILRNEEEAAPKSPPVPPRREFVWRAMAMPQSLATIAPQITRDLDLRCASIHRLVSSDGGSIHRCPGYVREEVTLATRTADSAVVSYNAPTIQEVCSVCHEIVTSGEVFRCVCGEREPGSRPTVKCRFCKSWSHRDCGLSSNGSCFPPCPSHSPLSRHHAILASLQDQSRISPRKIAVPVPGPLPVPGFTFGMPSVPLDSGPDSPVDFSGFTFPRDDTDTDDGSASYQSRFSAIAADSAATSAYYSDIGTVGGVPDFNRRRESWANWVPETDVQSEH
ncbi:hypothetical protein FB45DRAFT_2719 [Roridomyces roridus]|uniref:Protein kinase domain-containing protein n=1 Tax=Roridomyces roridus TaxID=1738132 RepID=A0AAD7CI35_9AGAR|nr:hypothetical protein FB45DRAFT_2719 [Roridomyces roridus]